MTIKNKTEFIGGVLIAINGLLLLGPGEAYAAPGVIMLDPLQIKTAAVLCLLIGISLIIYSIRIN